jgi:hypothetical protein
MVPRTFDPPHFNFSRLRSWRHLEGEMSGDKHLVAVKGRHDV